MLNITEKRVLELIQGKYSQFINKVVDENPLDRARGISKHPLTKGQELRIEGMKKGYLIASELFDGGRNNELTHQEVMDRLEEEYSRQMEKVITQFKKGYETEEDIYYEGLTDGIHQLVMYFMSLEEEQVTLPNKLKIPEVPQFVADYFESLNFKEKEEFTRKYKEEELFNEDKSKEEEIIEQWIKEHTGEFVDLVLKVRQGIGYTIKK